MQSHRRRSFRRPSVLGAVLFILTATAAYRPNGAAASRPESPSIALPAQADAPLTAAMIRIRVPWIANDGQLDRQVRYSARTFAGTVFVTDDALTYALPAEASGYRGLSLREQFVGVRRLRPAGNHRSGAKLSYFVGDESKWRSNVATYDAVGLGELWPHVHVELRAYGRNVEKLFTVRPGADPDVIRMTVAGADALKVDGTTGELVLRTRAGDVRMTKPVAFQNIDGNRHSVDVAYEVSGRSYGFRLGAYDETSDLVIDPLIASTFVGGETWENPYDMTTDANGNVYITGNTFSFEYPLTPGAYDQINDKNQPTDTTAAGDVYISKLSPDLSQLLASTFLGSTHQDWGRAIVVEPGGNVVVAGMAGGFTFPTTPGAYSRTWPDSVQLFAAKFNSDMTSLIASTLFGGTANDDVDGIALDSAGNIVIVGPTSSPNFPTTPGVYNRTLNLNGFGGADDIYALKFDSGLTTVLASTFVGGSATDRTDDTHAHAVAIDSADNIYVVGRTVSSNYPTTDGAYDRTLAPFDLGGPSPDVVVSKLNGSLTSLLASTYIGGGGEDHGTAIALDAEGNVYITGWATRAVRNQYPTTPGAYSSTAAQSANVIVSKLDNGLTTLLASTFLGTDFNDHGWDIALNSAGDVFVTGRTAGGFPATAGAFDTTWNGSDDAFIAKFDSNLSSLLAATYVGGSGGEEARAIDLASDGHPVIMGATASASFPTTASAYDRTYSPWGGTYDVFITKLTGDLSFADRTAPDTAITSSVAGSGASIESGGLTSSSSITFEFAGSDNISVESFDCSIDGGAYAACTSGATYTALAGGSHTFSVRARDGSGNVDSTPATFTWEIDPTPPETTITSSASGSGAVTNGGLTGSSSMTFEFVATDNIAVAGIECSLDGAAFTSCSSPLALTALGEGSHTLAVSSIDTAGNVDATPATFTWTIDLTPPVLSAGDVVAEATSASGAAVTYDISATDSGESIAPTCSHASGATFGLGVTTVSCTATDAAGNTGSTTFTVTVRDTTPPAADGGGATTAEDSAATITLVASDAVVSSLTYTIATQPAHGTLTLTGDTVVYQPSADYSGSDSFTFTASDGTNQSAPAAVNVTVTPVNDDPIARPDSYRTPDNAVLTVTGPGVLANDTDIDSTLTAVLVSGPSGGTLTLRADGSFSYQPNGIFSGVDSFTYRASDGIATSAPVTVSIDVTLTNRAPACSAAVPSVSELWPPNHRLLLPVGITGVTDADGDAVSIRITAILQDEPTDTMGDGSTAIDGFGVGTSQALLRAERVGAARVPGNGRVYEVEFTATDARGASCRGSVTVRVPHDRGRGPAIDDGVRYDSTVAGGGRVR